MLKRIALVALSLMLVVGGIAAQQVLKLAEIHPQGYPTELADEQFAKLVNQYTNGQIKIDVYPGGQVSADEKVVIEQVKIGAIAIARVSSGALGAFNAQLNVFSLPYLFDSGDHMWNFLLSPYGMKMLDDLAPSGFVGLCWYDGGARSFYANYPMNSVADLKGKKFRVMGNPLLIKMVEAMGASAVPMAAGQVFSSIQGGVIDGAENNAPSYVKSFNHYQVAKFYMIDEHLRLPEVLFMNKAAWDRLSATQKTAVKKAAAETVSFQRKAWADYDIESMNIAKADPTVKITYPDKAPFQAAVKDLVAAESSTYAATLKAIADAKPKK